MSCSDGRSAQAESGCVHNAGIDSVMIVFADRLQAQQRVRFKALVQHRLQDGIAHAWTGVDGHDRQDLSGKLIVLARDS